MSKSKLLFVSLLLAVWAIPAFSQSASPVHTVEVFFDYDGSQSQVFSRQNIDARKKWFSVSLYNLLMYELKREAVYLKQNPTDKPYFGDGLPFRPYDETCKVSGKDVHRKVTITRVFTQKSRAAVIATFDYPNGCTEAAEIIYTIGLVKERGKWVIDDVDYGQDTTLKQRLNRKEY